MPTIGVDYKQKIVQGLSSTPIRVQGISRVMQSGIQLGHRGSKPSLLSTTKTVMEFFWYSILPIRDHSKLCIFG